jgi:hypothetical protein
MSALARIKSGSRGTGDETSPELLRSNEVIAHSEKRLRMVLIRHFCTRGALREKAGRHGIPKSTYWDLVDEAVWYFHTEYDKPDVAMPDKNRYLGSTVGVSSPVIP